MADDDHSPLGVESRAGGSIMAHSVGDFAEVERLGRELAAGLAGIPRWVPSQELRDLYGRARAQATVVARLLWRIGRETPAEPDALLARTVERIADNVVFPGGVHKSGTTLLRNLLDHHPSLLVLPVDGLLNWIFQRGPDRPIDETRERAFLDVCVKLLIGQANSGEPVGLLGTGPADVAPYVTLARHYAHWMERTPPTPGGVLVALVGALLALETPEAAVRRRFWVVKGTFSAALIARLTAAFPRARFLHIIRHPAAVICAQKRKQLLKRRRADVFRELEILYEGIRLALDNERRLGRDRYRVLRYEDLVSDPEAVMRHVAEFLSIDFDKSLVTPTVYGRPAGANTAHPDVLDEVGTVFSLTVDRWREELSPAEVCLIESYLGPLLNAFGYGRGARGVTPYLRAVARVVREYRRDERVRDMREVRPILRGLLRVLWNWGQPDYRRA